jgi:hypothetical protein
MIISNTTTNITSKINKITMIISNTTTITNIGFKNNITSNIGDIYSDY